jgi:aryl-alcohol dehydrogenase-like predicted oxidoreductase
MIPKRRIQRTALDASVLCFGLSGLGIDGSEKESFALLDHFVAQGGNFFDTARIYSDWFPGERSRSERIFGDYMASRKNRDQILLCTKGVHPALENMDQTRVNPREIMFDLEASLKALRTDHIDLYLLHRDGIENPVADILGTLDQARQQGKIREYGISNWSAARLQEAIALERSGQIHGIRMDQEQINVGSAQMNPPSDHTMRDWSLAMAQTLAEAKTAVMSYSCQAGGFFQKMAAGETIGDSCMRYDTPRNRQRAQRLQALSQDTGIGITQLALLYLLQAQKLQVFPVFRCRTMAQLEDVIKSCQYLDTPVDFADLRDFE